MNRIFAATLIGSMLIPVVPSSALAFYCVARSTNGVRPTAPSFGKHSKLRGARASLREVIATAAFVPSTIVDEP
jgi:hypothetical protein